MSRIISLNEVRQRRAREKSNKLHLDFVHQQGCCLCGRFPVEAHHLKMVDGVDLVTGTGRRAADRWAIPLCPDHHRGYHGAPQSYQAKYGPVMEEMAKYLWSISPGQKKGGTPEGSTDMPPV